MCQSSRMGTSKHHKWMTAFDHLLFWGLHVTKNPDEYLVSDLHGTSLRSNSRKKKKCKGIDNF